MATIKFQVINEKSPDETDRIATQIETTLAQFPDLQTDRRKTYHVTFPTENREQWRCWMFVSKHGRTKTTWEQVYIAINQIHACHYEFVR